MRLDPTPRRHSSVRVRRRVLITVQPVESHVRPIQPIAHTLALLGHDVRVAAAPSFGRRFRDTYLLPHIPAGNDWTAQPAVSTRLANLLAMNGNDAFCRAVIGDYLAGDPALQMAQDILTLSEGWRPEIILRDCTELGGHLAGSSLRVPVLSLDNGFARLMSSYDHIARPALNSLRATLGLGPESEDDAPRALLTPAPRDLLLHDLGEPITEYRHDNAERRDERLLKWVAKAPTDQPLIYASLGSIVTCGAGLAEIATDIYDRVIRALNAVDCTAIVAVGKTDRSRFRPARHVRIVSYIAQPSLLQAGVSLFITHGGFRSLREALHARVPMVVIPICSDQPANALRCGELGLGFPLDRNADIHQIRDAIKIVLDAAHYRTHILRWQRKALTLSPLSRTLDRLIRTTIPA